MAIVQEHATLIKTCNERDKSVFTVSDKQELKAIHEVGGWLLTIPNRQDIPVTVIYNNAEGEYKKSKELCKPLSDKIHSMYKKPSQFGVNISFLSLLIDEIA